MSNEYGQGEKALSRAGGMVLEAKGDFDNISKQLMNDVEALLAKWGGEGARSFGNLSREWAEKQQKIVSALNTFEQNLNATEKDNVSTDDSQSASMTSIRAGLDAAPGV